MKNIWLKEDCSLNVKYNNSLITCRTQHGRMCWMKWTQTEHIIVIGDIGPTCQNYISEKKALHGKYHKGMDHKRNKNFKLQEKELFGRNYKRVKFHVCTIRSIAAYLKQ
ncbi:hypothetical protein WA026_012722 [Henosepilachna vigintioctopunctata]|uniref:Uncharacterized protein n=1 Tax=Henosepilachna vigintioctopunctata TaxID=420089 RepID=A0AAW1U712_9CUCU